MSLNPRVVGATLPPIWAPQWAPITRVDLIRVSSRCFVNEPNVKAGATSSPSLTCSKRFRGSCLRISYICILIFRESATLPFISYRTVYSILLIEDDPSIARGLRISLEAEHYEVVHHTDGDKGYYAAQTRHFDVILLDLILPGKNGEDICVGLRAKGNATPILMLTSKKDEVDRVMGLDIGADDYVTKPFSLPELHARIRALLRRPPELKLELDTYAFGDVFVDLKRTEVWKNGALVQLSKKEMDLLHYFIAHEGEVITRDMLLDHVWGYETYPVTRTVDNFILALRKKLEDDPRNPAHLLTVPTVGYKFQRGDAA